MNKILNWLRQSSRWKHLIGGLVLGGLANSWYCAIYTLVAVASALELKDMLWGGKWDWTDWITTISGILGFLIRLGIIFLITL